MSHKYRTLNPAINEIRLLCLQFDGENSEGLKCSLEHVSLDQLPNFTALSYCWGDSEKTYHVLLDGQQYPVTTNLYFALRQLRTFPDRPRLWVDSICINQDDPVEKARQIMLMGSIYKRSRRVIAWIGQEDHTTAQTFNLLRRTPVGIVTSLPSKDTEVMITGLQALCSREYWQRVWILQELTLARQVVICCGNSQLLWHRLCDVFKALSKVFPAVQAPRQPSADGFNCLLMLKSKQNWRLFEVLSLSLASKSSEPRDKVFGLLGLVTDGSDFVAIPNYVQSLEEVNQSMLLTYIAATEILDPLALLCRGIGNRECELKHPSWVPKWHDLSDKDIFHRLAYLSIKSEDIPIDHVRPYTSLQYFKNEDFSKDGRFPGQLPLLRYKAAGSTLARPIFQMGCLTCTGMNIGHIEELGLSSLDTLVTQIGGSGTELPNAYAAGRDTLIRTFTAIYLNFFTVTSPDPTKNPTKNVAESRNAYDYHLSAANSDGRIPYLTEFLRIWRSPSYNVPIDDVIQSWINAHRSFHVHGKTMQEWAKWMAWTKTGLRHREVDSHNKKSLTWRSKWQVVAWKELLVNIKRGRRLIITSHGYVGWAIHKAQKWDAVFILQGCTVPVILRKREEGGYYVIGDAYVQGVMMGEAVKGAKEDDWMDVPLY